MGAGDVTPTSAAGRSWVTSGPAVPAVTTSPATCAPHVRRSNKSIDGRFRKCRAAYLGLYGQQRSDVQPGQFCPTCEESELQQDDNTGHDGPGPPYQLRRRGCGPAGREDIVDDQHPVTWLEPVDVDLERG